MSDGAEACPECGFAIKKHYAQIKQEEKLREIQERRMANITMPKEPINKFDDVSKTCLLLGIVFFSGSLIGFLVEYPAAILLFICSVIVLIGAFVIRSVSYNNALDAYERAMNDFEQYKKDIIANQDAYMAREALKPKCPHCNSTNIERISTLDRAVSIELVGLASNKIGKQYKCKSCKHVW